MDNILEKLKEGSLVPFLGMGVFKETVAKDGSILPFDSDSMILALNNGRAMSPRLMYEYSRAAMSLEQRKGRDFIVQMTNHIFSSKEYELPSAYTWLSTIKPKYVIDTNMDDSLQKIYSDVEHFLITGVSRITADYDRFVIYKYEPATSNYTKIEKEALSLDLPILFKPMGTTKPEMNFIVSDADFVDWLTEAMGGFALPPILKEFRSDKEYLFMGVDFSKDTFRMVANEITIGLKGGITLLDKEELTKKENKFIKTHNLENLNISINEFIKSNV
ncbi:SIR2 family protein [Arcobacter sp. LA11]|uniref:SIR2 family protein n=1 Tax=Arcobacter sp. LA11 TaxID=1898176 RepID=UPI000933AD09|nr:SIR2 family protein [Arcobacter sp. LA11]